MSGRFRFSLRTLLAAVTVAGVALALRDRPPAISIALDTPQLRIVALEEGDEVFEPMIEIVAELINDEHKLVFFEGYEEDSPFYEVLWREAGTTQWNFRGYRRCASGVVPQSLDPGKVRRFKTRLDPKLCGREVAISLGVTFSGDSSYATESEYHEIVSQPIKIPQLDSIAAAKDSEVLAAQH